MISRKAGDESESGRHFDAAIKVEALQCFDAPKLFSFFFLFRRTILSSVGRRSYFLAWDERSVIAQKLQTSKERGLNSNHSQSTSTTVTTTNSSFLSLSKASRFDSFIRRTRRSDSFLAPPSLSAKNQEQLRIAIAVEDCCRRRHSRNE